MKLFRKDKDGDSELTPLGWLLVPLSATLVIGTLYQILEKPSSKSVERLNVGAASPASICGGSDKRIYPMVAAGPLGVDTRRGRAAMELIGNGSYQTLRVYENGGYCYADIRVAGTVDGTSYSFDLSPMLATGR